MSKIKKILTLDQLVKFCEQNKLYTFNAKDTGYTLSVRVPAVFSGDVISEKGLLFCPIKVCHTLKNRNGSYISEENMKKAMPSLKYRPFLAAIHQLDNGEWDFHSHDMEIIENEDGEEEVNYIEKQIGCFTADEPYLEYDKEMDKTYVHAKVAIPEEYTKAADIIRAKKGSKVSCELNIESMSYNNDEKALSLDDFYFSGCTGLGREKDGTEIGEGMLGSELGLEDFSTKNNSMFSQENYTDDKLIETLEKINTKLDELTTLSNFNIKQNNQAEAEEQNPKEGGNETVTKFEELLKKYNKTKDEIEFEVEGLTDEELEAKFTEVFGEANENGEDPASDGDNATDPVPSTNAEDPVAPENDEGVTNATDPVVTNAEDPVKPEDNADKPEKYSKTFELSHDDIRYALYTLLMPYEDSDNDWYWITEVYDNHFVYQGCSGNYFGQKYTKDGDTVAFDGERYELFAEFVTESERSELEAMRSNYAELKQFKADTENEKLHSEREAVLTAEKYAVLAEKEVDTDGNEKYKNEAYAKLVSEMDNYSLDDLEKEVKSVFADYITSGGQFACHTSDKDSKNATVAKKVMSNADHKQPGRYGNLFSDK